jgi:8-oxo-dGTP diphosphatase
MKTKYVLGLLFNQNLTEVALIRKNRPDWQKGYLNGIGGKVEENESIQEAMRREFFEETGCVLYDWESIGEMEGDNFIVYVFKRAAMTLHGVKTMTDEEVIKVKVDEIYLRRNEMISNIPWLIYACLDDGFKKFKFEY